MEEIYSLLSKNYDRQYSLSYLPSAVTEEAPELTQKFGDRIKDEKTNPIVCFINTGVNILNSLARKLNERRV